MFSVYSIAGTVAKTKQASDWAGVRIMGSRRRKHLHLRGVELTRFALFYCFLVREKLGLQVYMFSYIFISEGLS